jgi:hypothetical protein
MPNRLTSEYRRAYRARCIAEGRCANCGRVRADDDRDTLNCHACRVSQNRDRARRRADQREANPPAFAWNDLRVPFRYGNIRLKNPRRVNLTLDIETLDYIDRMRVFWKMSEDYEPYLVSEFIRRMIPILQDYDGPMPCIRGLLPRRESSGLQLCFLCDEDNWAVIQRHREKTGCSISTAVRVCLCTAGEILLNKMPDDSDLPLLRMPDDRPVRDVFPLRSHGKPQKRDS